MKRDPWSVLGVRVGASAREVRAAWRRAVSRWHPDRNPSPDATARLEEINVALADITGGIGASRHQTFADSVSILAGLDGTVFGREWQRGQPAPRGLHVELEVPLVPWLADRAVTLGIPLEDDVTTIVTLIHPHHFSHGSVLVFPRSGLDPAGSMEDLVVTLRIAAPALDQMDSGSFSAAAGSEPDPVSDPVSKPTPPGPHSA